MKDYGWIAAMLNFMVNFLLLLGTNRLCARPPGGLRDAAASALGTAHLVLCLLPGFSFLGNWIWRMVFLGLMALVAFGMRKSTLKQAAVFALLQLAVAGIAAGDGFWTVTIATLVIFLLCMAGKTGPGTQHVAVKIVHGGRSVELMALLDTGNTLKDPITGKSVIVADAGTAGHLLGLDAMALSHPISTLESGKGKGLRLIPYSAIGQPKGLLLGLKPDSMTIDGKKTDHILAFAPQSIGQGNQFQALAGGII